MIREQFIDALRHRSLDALQSVPKSDLHSHAGRGGSLSYIEKWANARIIPPSEPFSSLDEMNKWLNEHVKPHCPPGIPGYTKRVEAAFAQAHRDHISVLALSYGIDEVFVYDDIQKFIELMDGLHREYAPDTVFLPDLSLGYDPEAEVKLDEILDAKWFRGIDICNYSNKYTLSQLKPLCKKARDAHLILKAHVGEFDGAESVMRYAEELELDQVQHGIGAANSPQVMNWLADHRIQLNICPTSNIMLRNADSYPTHPIRRLFDFGVPVTINTDDLIIFNATASQEYLHLYDGGLMTAEELNQIRETGLNSATKWVNQRTVP